MHVPYVVWIAWRYMRSRVRQTALTITGVALGVTVVAIMQSYWGGFLNYFISRALASTPNVTVTQAQPGVPSPSEPLRRATEGLRNPRAIGVTQLPVPDREETLKNPKQAEEIIAGIPGVATISPFVTGSGVVMNGDIRQPISFVGIRPLQEAQVTDIANRIVEGRIEDLAVQSNGIILGSVLAENISARVGDRVSILSSEGLMQRFRVVGRYSSQLEDVDAIRAFINLRQAQLLLDITGVSGLGIKTTTLDEAVPVARRIEEQTNYIAKTWREVNSGFIDLFTTISMIFYLVTALTMVVAGFGIANTLILTVNEKRRDIGVLKALGAPPQQIAYLFVTLGLLVGVFGVILGELIGWAGIVILSNTPIPLEQGQGPPIAVETFPMLRIPRVYIVAGVFGLLVSVVSSVLPSLKAAKADPLEVIRSAE